MKIVVWKAGMWLDVGRDPCQFYIQPLYRCQEIQLFILPVLYSLCNYKLKLMEVCCLLF